MEQCPDFLQQIITYFPSALGNAFRSKCSMIFHGTLGSWQLEPPAEVMGSVTLAVNPLLYNPYPPPFQGVTDASVMIVAW